MGIKTEKPECLAKVSSCEHQELTNISEQENIFKSKKYNREVTMNSTDELHVLLRGSMKTDGSILTTHKSIFLVTMYDSGY